MRALPLSGWRRSWDSLRRVWHQPDKRFRRGIVVLKILQAFGLIDLLPVVFLAPSVVGNLVYTQAADHFANLKAPSPVDLTFSQLQYCRFG